jgi:RNA polymerase sigma factor (sigma-70 family)
MEFSNEELWEQLRSGKRSAIEDLYRFNYQVLYSYALKISGNKELSMDCVQDLFVRLWEKRDQLNAVSKVRSYLLQSIWHSVIKIMKKQRKNMLIDENSHYDIEVVFPHLDSLIESQEKDSKKTMLNSALNNLSSRQKEIIFMQYYEGLTIEEIQQITELKYQSIKNLTHRAMIVLRESFKLKKK